MSTDEKVTADIVQTLKDGEHGYAQAADQLADSAPSATVQRLREFSQQRASFAAELDQMAAAYGDDIDESGSLAAAGHRGWMKLKDALTGSDSTAVLGACETGDEHAVTEYEKALDEDISEGLRTVLSRQLHDIRAAHATVSALATK